MDPNSFAQQGLVSQEQIAKLQEQLQKQQEANEKAAAAASSSAAMNAYGNATQLANAFPHGTFTMNEQQNQQANQLPLSLMGASPLQQQLSALSGLTANMTNNNNGQQQQAIAPQLSNHQQQQQQDPNQQLQQLMLQQQQQMLQQLSSSFQQQQQQQQQTPTINMSGAGFSTQLLQQLMVQQLMGQHLQQQQQQHQQQQQAPVLQGLNLGALMGANVLPNQFNVLPTVPTQTFATANTEKPDDGINNSSNKNAEDWAEPFAGKGKKEPPFPLKLHQILGNPEFAECICWNLHGRSWRILKPPMFEQIVIPLYFRHAKYASFMRQVNGWGFKRIVSGNDHNSYYHENFIREYPQLCLKMKRIKKSDISSKTIKSDEQDTSSLMEDPATNQYKSVGNVNSAPAPQTNNALLAMASALPGLVATGAAPNTNNMGWNSLSALAQPNALTSLGAFGSQQQSQLLQKSAYGQAPVSTSAPATSAPSQLDASAALAGLGQLDSNTLAMLQEALSASGGANNLLLQHQQQQQQQATLLGQLGGAGNNNNNNNNNNAVQLMAAQLQAASQPVHAANSLAVAANGANNNNFGGDYNRISNKVEYNENEQNNDGVDDKNNDKDTTKTQENEPDDGGDDDDDDDDRNGDQHDDSEDDYSDDSDV